MSPHSDTYSRHTASLSYTFGLCNLIKCWVNKLLGASIQDILNSSEIAMCFPDYPGMGLKISKGYTQEYTLINSRT